MKPRFELTRIYSDGTKEEPRIVPLVEAIESGKMNRRGFLAASLTAAAAVMFLDGKAISLTTTDNVSDNDFDCSNFRAHKGLVNALTVHPDGKSLYSAGDDGYIKIWSLPDGALVKTMEGHKKTIIALAIHPMGRYLYSGDADGVIKIWNLPDGTLQKSWQGHNGKITALAIASDGSRLISGSVDNTIKMWESPDGTLSRTLKKHKKNINALAAMPDDNRFFSGGGYKGNGIMFMWSLYQARVIKKNIYKADPINSFAFSPSDGLLIAGCDHSIKLFNLRDGVVNKSVKVNDRTFDLAVTRGNSRLVSRSRESITLWNLPDLEFKLKVMEPCTALTVTPNGDLMISGDNAGRIKLWKLPDLTFDKCLMDIAASPSTVQGNTYSITDKYGRVLTYTLPCGSPIPPGATCICNCVPGGGCTCNKHCTCDSVCTCNPQKVCTCERVCTCNPQKVCSCNPQRICTCERVCTCNPQRVCSCQRVCVCLAV